ncbi:MAG TPA: hypothetical protein QF698_06820, partial [Candidatus Marinimicrobia bacterium]|nr:hypothetical protein [Candidatus Neomarinimicrobiota bacterium]
PRALGSGGGLIGRVRPVGEEDEEQLAGNDLLDTVLNVNGKSTMTVTYQDTVRPEGIEQELSDQARLRTSGNLAITNEGYDESVELLHVGEKLFVMVSDPDLDTSDERDTATAIIQSQSGEKESVKLNETLSHSGIFTGSFELKAREKPTPDNFSEIDKEIECFFGDKITTAYSDEAAGNEEGGC